MEYCGAYPIRKPVPKGRFASGVCSGADHRQCPYFNEFMAGVRLRFGRESACAAPPETAAGGSVFCSFAGCVPTRPEPAPEPGARDAHRGRHRRRVPLRHVRGIALHPGFFYHRGHTWVMPYAVEEARIGLDGLGQRLLQGAAKIQLPARKSLLQEGRAAVRVDCGDRHAWLVSPVDGVVAAVNEDLLDDVSLLSRDPYGDGWLLAVRLRDDSFATLPTGSSAAEWLRAETDRLGSLLHDDLGPTAADGGELVGAPAASLDSAQWEALAEAFFLHRTDGGQGPRF